MKVLMVNKFFYPFGGAESTTRHTMKWLESQGHEVIPFSMHHPSNWPSEYSKYFVGNVDFKTAKYGLLREIKEALRIIYSIEAERNIAALIAETDPDIAHCHNIYHQLSPSVLPAIKAAGIPIVHSLHDGKLVCPAYRFFVDGEICERCGGRNFYHCLLRKCVKDSRAKSFVCMIETYIHMLTRIYERNVDIFITPSQFLRSKILASGRFNPERVVQIYSSVDVNAIRVTEPGDYVLYLGQVEDHKGVFTLLRAMEQCPNIPLKMAGKGSADEGCARFIAEKGLKNVEMLGFQTGKALEQIIRDTAFLVQPAEWYENCPLVVVEAASHGKPAVASRLGGLNELVEDGITGLHAEPKNSADLAEKISAMWSNRNMMREMGLRAREKAEREFSHEVHFKKLLDTYSLASDICAKRR